MSWWGKFKMKNNEAKTTPPPDVGSSDLSDTVYSVLVKSSTIQVPASPSTTIINTAGAATISNTNSTVFPRYIYNSSIFGASTSISNLLTIKSPQGKEIVRLNVDGSVTWADNIDVNAAANAFAESLTLSAEIRAGLTTKVKLKMRDSVFEDIISIAKQKDHLTADDLTFMLEASKIVEKLKGVDNE